MDDEGLGLGGDVAGHPALQVVEASGVVESQISKSQRHRDLEEEDDGGAKQRVDAFRRPVGHAVDRVRGRGLDGVDGVGSSGALRRACSVAAMASCTDIMASSCFDRAKDSLRSSAKAVTLRPWVKSATGVSHV